MNISGIDFITLLVSDLEESFNFYTKMLGLTESPEKQPNAHAFATRPIGMAIRQSADRMKINNPGQGIIIWLKTTDASALYNDLKEGGVPITAELRKSPFGMTFSFKDPDGYILTVHDGG
jgi:predicted enzyme related to lactoylglutathione lyase